MLGDFKFLLLRICVSLAVPLCTRKCLFWHDCNSVWVFALYTIIHSFAYTSILPLVVLYFYGVYKSVIKPCGLIIMTDESFRLKFFW